MVLSKHLLVLFLIPLLVLYMVEAENYQKMNDNGGGSSFVPKRKCGEACATRCRLASRQKMCKRACGTCCARCNCVPPGTSGNQEACPCYYNMTTHGGRRKCP